MCRQVFTWYSMKAGEGGGMSAPSLALPAFSTGRCASAIDDTLLTTKRPQFSEQKIPVQDKEF